MLIRAPIQKSFTRLINFLEVEGSRVCDRIVDYSKRWKQPINVDKTVTQFFFSQVQNSEINIYMLGQKLGIVDTFKYLEFTWATKLPLKSTVYKSIEKIHKSLGKLKWLCSGKMLSKSVLRSCFFAYFFPHFA